MTAGCSVTLQELETVYSLDDLFLLHRALDAKEQATASAIEDALAALGGRGARS